MIIDCHAHFEPRMLDVSRVIEKMDAARVDRIAMIPAMNAPLPVTPKGILAMARTLMSHRTTRPLAELAHRATLTKSGDLRLMTKVYRIYARPDNAPVAELVAQHPKRFMGWIFIDPRDLPGETAGTGKKRALDEIEKWRAVPGMVGLKLHPHWHDYRTDVLTPIFARAEELRLPCLIHLGFGARGDFRAICSRFPRLVVISAHAGFPFYGDLWVHAADHPNLHVDLSSPYIDERLARAAVRAMGPERCLYGTDAPYGFHVEDGSYDYGEIRGWVERLDVSSAKREAIFGANFERLLSDAGTSLGA